MERGHSTPSVKWEKEVTLRPEELVRNYFLDTGLVFRNNRWFESLNVLSGYFNAAAHVSVVPEPAAISSFNTLEFLWNHT